MQIPPLLRKLLKMTPAKLQGRDLFTALGSPRKIVAPMVDQSELAWRILCRKNGATLCYTPMFHAKLFATQEKYRTQMWGPQDGDPASDRPLIVQFCANDPDYLLQAARLVSGRCDAVDINFGCPQGIARKGHYGAFLMDDWSLVRTLISRLNAELDVPVTAKIRIFSDKHKTLEYAKMILDAGAQFLTVHGRTRDMKGQQTGFADWETLRFLRDNLPPETVLFANGNVVYAEDTGRCLAATKFDAVMSAEGVLYNPAIFRLYDEKSGKDKFVASGSALTEHMDELFPRVDHVLREYFNIVKEIPGIASRKALKTHCFNLLRSFLEVNSDLRPVIGRLGSDDAAMPDWEALVAEVEKRVAQIYEKGKENGTEVADHVTEGPIELWGGSYKEVPYWRCQPCFRTVNGVSNKEIVRRIVKERMGKSVEEESREPQKEKDGSGENGTKRKAAHVTGGAEERAETRMKKVKEPIVSVQTS